MKMYQEAPSLNLGQLETMASQIRAYLGFADCRWLPVPHIIEHVLPEKYGDAYSFRVEDERAMGSNHGYADLPEGELVLRSDVYEGMVAGVGRDRMTAMHEMSHLYVHDHTRLYRRMSTDPPPPWRDPEWQAKALAGAIMMPRHLLTTCKSIRQVTRDFGVSEPAARHRIKQIGGTLPF